MENEHQLIAQVCAAREDSRLADELIQSYIPFIRSEAAKFLCRPCTDQEDEFSIAMIAFYEAILGYEKRRGAFLPYAALLIRSRLIDHTRKEAKHRGHISLHTESGEEDDRTLLDRIPDEKDRYEESATRAATRQEIEELSGVLSGFGLTFADVADNTPRQERTLAACARAIRQAVEAPGLLEELLRTKKLPLAQLTALSGVPRKTLERHRDYLVAMLLIQTNGYEIIRGHLQRVLKKGGIPA